MENFEGVVSYFWPMVTLGPLPFGRLHGKIIALLGARKYTTPIPYTCTSTPLVVVIAHDIKIDEYTWNVQPDHKPRYRFSKAGIAPYGCVYRPESNAPNLRADILGQNKIRFILQ